jgi:hypothetical protein
MGLPSLGLSGSDDGQDRRLVILIHVAPGGRGDAHPLDRDRSRLPLGVQPSPALMPLPLRALRPAFMRLTFKGRSPRLCRGGIRFEPPGARTKE